MANNVILGYGKVLVVMGVTCGKNQRGSKKQRHPLVRGKRCDKFAAEGRFLLPRSFALQDRVTRQGEPRAVYHRIDICKNILRRR